MFTPEAIGHGEPGAGMDAAILPLARETSPAPPRIRVVIPALNEAEVLGPLLASLGAPSQGPEVVVVDGGSTDHTRRMGREAGARVVSGKRGRGAQMNAGARLEGATEPDALLFLHADSRLPAGALDAVGDALGDPTVVGGRFRLRYPDSHPVLSFLGVLSRFSHGWFAYGDQGFFVRKSVFATVGGFQEIPLFEDVRFFKELQSRGRTVVLPLAVTTSGRRFRRNGVVRQLLTNAALVAGHSMGVSPHRLARRYRG